MQWIAPSEKDPASAALEKQLQAASDQLRANSGLKAADYSAPFLGLIFLRFAEARFDPLLHRVGQFSERTALLIYEILTFPRRIQSFRPTRTYCSAPAVGTG